MVGDRAPRPRVVVLGAQGLLGWHVAAALGTDADVVVPAPRHAVAARFAAPAARVVGGPLDVASRDAASSLRTLLGEVRPAVVVNAIAVTPSSPGFADRALLEHVNATFPHQLSDLCAEVGSRVLHVSTDGVFRGDRDVYREADEPDAMDPYGSSKARGELRAAHCITLRTSFFGASPSGRGLWEWLLAQPAESTVPGYVDYVFTPLSAATLAGSIAALVRDPRGLHGVVHAGGSAVSKHDLLHAASRWAGQQVRVQPTASAPTRRVLASERLWGALGRDVPTLQECLDAQRTAPFAMAYPDASRALPPAAPEPREHAGREGAC